MLLQNLINNAFDAVKETVNKYKLTKEINKLLEKAKDIAPLKFWIGKEFFNPSPRWELLKVKITEVVISIKEDDIKVEALWDNGMWYNNPAFYSEEEAKNICKDIAWMYIESLKQDKEYYEKALERCNEAIKYATDENWKKISEKIEKENKEVKKKTRKTTTKKVK